MALRNAACSLGASFRQYMLFPHQNYLDKQINISQCSARNRPRPFLVARTIIRSPAASR